MSVLSMVKSVFLSESWCCAVRFNSDEKKCILNDSSSPFTVIPDTKRYWTADPFLVKENNKFYLFFEAFDRMKRKGLIGYREISQNHFGDIRIIYESKSHLSFPFIYKENGDYYIIPESNQQNELFRLKCVSFPNKWEKEKVISNGHLVDTVLFSKDDIQYYISEKIDSRTCYDRVDLFYEQNGEFTESSKNPVKKDVNNARGAGRLFEFEGMLIRPAQNCGQSYGEKLNFNRVTELTKERFEEKLLCEISVHSVNLNSDNKYLGIHTYNKIENVEVIDLKVPGEFNFYNIIGAFVKLFTKIIY